MLILLAIFAFSSVKIQPNEEKSFLAWMRNTNNIFVGDEYHLRLGIFLSNQRYVLNHNSDRENTFKLKMNHLAALTPSEYKSLLAFKTDFSRNLKKMQSKRVRPNAVEVDWRTKGAVNDIKDQGNCGSCWAFSAIQNCESAEFIKYNTLYRFSEQFLVDCDKSNNGCKGGLPYRSFNFIINECGGKVMLESDYPYEALANTCKYDESKAVGHFTHYIEVESGNEDELAATCEQYGPCSIGIDASHVSFQLYSSGIYDEHGCMPRFVNHGVGLVGYGSEEIHANFIQKYWIIRNSWGPSWGESGYIRTLRGNNQCGEASYATCIISE